ncbi:ankyrin repeat domain-containing protein [Vermiphilus pyriformis]|nr:MAG: ankyrin repeat domain-containing protein [Vermiphilus pyriformis]
MQDCDIVHFLIAQGASINCQKSFVPKPLNKFGITPLMLAIKRSSNTDFIQFLIDLGADVDLATFSPEETPLSCAVKENKIDVAKLLIKWGADINRRDSQGNTPLIEANCHSDLPMVQLLINLGADVNISDNDGWTPLHCAVAKGNENAVSLLYDAGADINYQTKDGCTPLLQCLLDYYDKGDPKNTTIIHYLISKGANANIKCKKGYSPLDIAKCYIYQDMLLAIEAKSTIKDRDNIYTRIFNEVRDTMRTIEKMT